MRLKIIQKVLGLLLALFSITILPSLIVSIVLADGAHNAFLIAITVTLVGGALMWLPVKNFSGELRLRDGFIIVVLFWLVLGLCGAIPFLAVQNPQMSVIDSIFESISGLTTT